MTNHPSDADLMTPAQVATLFCVGTKTVARWANSGKIPSIRTLGGHRRFHRDAIMEIYRAKNGSNADSDSKIRL